MRVRYIGAKEPITEAGIDFEPGKWVNVPDDHPRAAKLRGNPTFEVKGADPVPAATNAEAEIADAANAARQASEFDHDEDGKPGGSLTKAEITARLDAAGIEYDGRAKRDELAKLLAGASAPAGEG